jgi:hypothetical protein
VVRGRIELPTFRFSDGCPRQGILIRELPESPANPRSRWSVN